MRAILFGSTMFLTMLVSSADARAIEPKVIRRSEIIAFVSAQSQRQDAREPVQAGASSTGHNFVVHVLDRRSVALEETLSMPESDGAPEGSKTFALSAVPPWMLGGSSIVDRANSCIQKAYRPTGFLRVDAERRRLAYYATMRNIACTYGIPTDLFDALIVQESQYRPDALSPKNAFGLTQLMPGTALQLGVDRYSIEGNLNGGARYLRQQLDRFGQYDLALAAYNAGPGRIRSGRMPGIAETRAYVGNVLSNWSRLSAMASSEISMHWDDLSAAHRQVQVLAF